MRDEVDYLDHTEDVFGDHTLTAEDTRPPARKMPRMSSCDDMFADTPPIPQHDILSKFFGHYEPGVSPPQTVKLQILDILESTRDGFISNALYIFIFLTIFDNWI